MTVEPVKRGTVSPCIKQSVIEQAQSAWAEFSSCNERSLQVEAQLLK